MTQMPSQIERLAIDQLIPYARNSRTHSPEQVNKLAASLREYGFTNPVLIDGQGGIIAGHGRVMAARQCGLAEVPCIRLGHLTEAQKRAYVIADNRLAELSGWDQGLLQTEIADLAALGYTHGLIDELIRSETPIAAPSRAEIEALEAQAESETELPEHKSNPRKPPPALLPIVPRYGEHQQAFVIVCDNQIDAAWLRGKLGLTHPAQSYKNVNFAVPNVVSVEQLRDRLA